MLSMQNSTASQAQSFQVFSYNKPFIRLAQLPYRSGPINYVSFAGFGGNRFVDNLPVGFEFKFFGTRYAQFGVSQYGWVGFIRGTSDSFVNVAFGLGARPNGFIAPWWDNLNLGSATFSTSYAVFGTSPNRALVIEANNFSADPNVNDGGIWQVWLYETLTDQNGRFEIRVDGDLSDTYSASVGFEGVQGILGYSFLSCSPNCTAADATSDLIGKAYTVLNVIGPELVGEIISSPRGKRPGSTVNVQAKVQNIGTETAQTVSIKLFASTDYAFDSSDLMLAQATINSLGAGNSAQELMSFSSPSALATGDYYLLLEVDDNQSVPQTYRLDDHVVGASKFANAYDLLINSLSSQSSANPNDPFDVQFTVKQEGPAYSGSVDIALYASRDQAFDPSDARIPAPANITLSGSASQQFNLTGTLPGSIVPGQYHVIAIIDRLQQIDEHNEFNNRAVSATRFDSGPDFVATSVQLTDSIAPGSTSPVTTRIESQGVSHSGSVEYALYASLDINLNTQTDYLLGSFQAQFTGQSFIDGNETITVPSSIAPGAYYVFAVVDPNSQISETIESNNEYLSLARFLTHPDLSVSSVIAPSQARPGDTVSVSFDIQSLGQTVNTAVDYRIYLSSNPSLGASDIVVHDGATALTGGSLASVQASVVLPTNTLVRQWRILVEVDPNDFVVESHEANNVSASLSTMLVTGADLIVIPPLIGDSFAFVGRDYRLRGDIDNTGVAEAVDFKFAVYLSDNEVIGTADRRIFLSDAIRLAPGARYSFDELIPIPPDTDIEAQYLGVIADILSVVPETSELNNTLTLDQQVQVVAPSPDLRGQVIGAPSAAASGETIFITRLLDNLGVEDANQVRYAYYLSVDENIIRDDILLSSHQISLAQGSNDFGSDQIVIPGGIDPGDYFLGGLLDPDEVIDETNEDNNVFIAGALEIYAPSIRFVNEQLPRAIIGTVYEVGIFAASPTAVPAITVAQGQLPNGLRIEQATGYIRGTAEVEGLFAFTLRATVSTSAYIEQDFTLRAAQATTGLSVATEQVPVILTQKPFNFQVLASGGITPYQWTITSSTAMPEGLRLTESGEIKGTALITGQYVIDLQVTDDNGDQAMKRFTLFVLTPRQTVKIRQSDLPFGIVDTDYCELAAVNLRAERGIEPYVWSLDNEGVAGLSLSEDGRLCGTPTTPGEFSVQVRVTDRTGVFDSTTFFVRISAGEEFAVSTFALPLAVIGQPYESTVTAVRGTEPYKYALKDGELPPGIQMSSEGSIYGTATATGTYAFITEVIDARGRTRQQALSIASYFPAPKKVACQCSNTSPLRGQESQSMYLLLLLGLGLWIGRKRFDRI